MTQLLQSTHALECHVRISPVILAVMDKYFVLIFGVIVLILRCRETVVLIV